MNFPYGYDPENISIDDPASRRVILVVSRGERERIFYDQKYKKFKDSVIRGNTLKDGLCIVENTLELYDKKVQNFLQPIKSNGLLEAGNTLIQNTYKTSEYFKFNQEQIEEKVILEKWRHDVTICKYLGVKIANLNNQEEKEINSNSNFGINIVSTLFNLGSDNNYFVKNIEKKLRELSAEYPGSSPNVEEARKYIDKVGWSQDKDIDFLIDNRAGENPLAKFKQELNLFAQIENGFDLAVDLVIPQYLTKGSVKIKQGNNMIKKFITKVELTFS
ncbi:hypothetical protein [Nostoc sp. CCY 9925]|uniref:hypothetical protein n=1 Tax=Nostoc sp. CCY 9925 TaxID=3103865 RepID=UPI0039C6BC4B